MDVLKQLRDRVSTLSDTKFAAGLHRVVAHLAAAEDHIRRGQRGTEEAFCDAVYRTNQAFEGSLRETFRALTGKDGSKLVASEFEKFLRTHGLPKHVIAHFETYRREWRNVSAHDHLMWFREDEAILAFVSVCAIAILLVDEISSKVGATRGRKAARRTIRASNDAPLLERMVDALRDFRLDSADGAALPPLLPEITAAVTTYMGRLFPDVAFTCGERLVLQMSGRVDLLATYTHGRVIFEIKRFPLNRLQLGMTLQRLVNYMVAAELTEGILYVYRGAARRVRVDEPRVNQPDQRILMVYPVGIAPA